MSEFKVNTITNRTGSYGPQVCGITTFGGSGMTLPSGPTEMRGGRGRAVVVLGATPSVVDTMDFFETASTGNATDFGNLTDQRSHLGSASSHTRGLFAGGYDQPSFFNIIDFVEISTTGNAVDFGDLTFNGMSNGAVRNTAACSDSNGGLL